MLAAEAVKRYAKREEKETEKICETFAGRLEDIVARDAAEREEKEALQIAQLYGFVHCTSCWIRIKIANYQ